MKVLIECETWELQRLADLADTVLLSRQNVGRDMRDKADAVKKIVAKFRDRATNPQQPTKQ